MAEKTTPNRNTVYCLLCRKPQTVVSVHLARVCMKNKSKAAIKEEIQRAKQSMKMWISQARSWDYNELCSFIPNQPKRVAFVEKLQTRGFFVENLPNPADLVSDPEPVLEQPAAVASTAEALPQAGTKKCTQEQKDVRDYLAYCSAITDARNILREASALEHTSILISTLEGSSGDSADDGSTRAKRRTRKAEEDENKVDFSQFIKAFPVTLSGQPPNKRQRFEAGFSDERVFYDKWRAHQYARRGEHMLARYTRRPPTAKQVLKTIKKEGWKANHPDPEEVVAKWKPPQKTDVESDTRLMKLVQKQKWSGLAVKTFPGEIRHRVVATKRFPRGSILCDYHGRVISAAEGEKIHNEIQDNMYYMFFFSSGNQKLCIDAQTFPCECHPDMETIGRMINHSRKRANVVPAHCLMQFPEGKQHVILFKAMKDISVDEEICFDYGTNRKSCRGEGLDLEWLDE